MGVPTSRRYLTYDHCPLTTTADKQRFMLTSVKQIHSSGARTTLWAAQSTANTWMHPCRPYRIKHEHPKSFFRPATPLM